MLSLVPIVSERYFETFSAGMNESGKDNILRWLAGNIEFIHDWHERYNLEGFALANAHGAANFLGDDDAAKVVLMCQVKHKKSVVHFLCFT